MTVPEPVLRHRGWFEAAVAIVLVAFVDWAVLHAGLPQLRHDWRWPREATELDGELRSLFEGWSLTNLGEAQPYPTFYWIGFLLWPIRALLTPFSSMAIIVSVGIYVAARSAMRLVPSNVRAFHAIAACVATFAVLNPWVYTREVAGHVFLVLAYALLLALVAELSSQAPRDYALMLLGAASITLIEFFAVAVIPFILWCVREHRYGVIFAVALAAAPIVLGIAGNYGGLQSTPYNLAWQRSNSVDPFRGLALLGYSAPYALAFRSVAVASVGLGCLALFGVMPALRRPVSRACVIIAAVSFIVATGTKGPLAVPYAFLVTHVKESGLFRELYDFIAFVAIGYVIVLVDGLQRARVLAYAGLVAALAFAVPWIVAPPSSFTVSADRLPHVVFDHDPNARVALFPAFQPMSFGGRGSGTDPDDHPRSGDAIPINGFLPTFPVDAALAFAQERGDMRFLRALGVDRAIVRPYLHSDDRALRFQRAFGGARQPRARAGRDVRAASPLMGIVAGAPSRVSIASDPSEFAVFVAPPHFRVPAPSTATFDGARAWVDARLASSRFPEWATLWGGVATSGSDFLETTGARGFLGATDGEIVDAKQRVIAAGRGASVLHWRALAADARTLRCVGNCIVVAFGDPQSIPEHAAPARVVPIAFDRLAPWLATAAVRGRAGDTIRFDERYDSSWMAISGMHVLPHVALATVLNGWRLGPGDSGRVVFIEALAAAQLLSELLAFFAILTLAFVSAIRFWRVPERRTARRSAEASTR